jgi:hypothetical protein
MLIIRKKGNLPVELAIKRFESMSNKKSSPPLVASSPSATSNGASAALNRYNTIGASQPSSNSSNRHGSNSSILTSDQLLYR